MKRAENKERTLSLKVANVAVALFMVAFLIGCELVDPNPGPSPVEMSGTVGEPQEDLTPATVERGDSLFAALCARCHGDQGVGSDIWPPVIQGKTGISLLVRHGVRSMPGFPSLSDSSIQSIQLYLLSFDTDKSGLTGVELFDFYCATCHGPEAIGSSTYPGSIQGFRPIGPVVRDGFGEMPRIDVDNDIIAKIQEYLSGLAVDFSTLTGEEYFARVCASCHGAEGEGTRRGPEVRNPVRGYATYVVRRGRSSIAEYLNDMPGYDTDSLSDRQLTEILDFLGKAPHPTDGLGLYNRFCSNCHGKDARGGPVGEKILDETDEFREKVREGEGGRNYSDRREYMPSWSSSELSNEEIDKMSAYVRRLR